MARHVGMDGAVETLRDRCTEREDITATLDTAQSQNETGLDSTKAR